MLHLDFALSVNAGVLSIKFCLQKRQQQQAKHCGIYKYLKSTRDAYSKSDKNEYAFFESALMFSEFGQTLRRAMMSSTTNYYYSSCRL